MAWRYTLHDLARTADASADVPDIAFSSVSTDTRTIQPGDVFFALSGENFDGNRFVPDAFQKGAAAAVTTRPSNSGPCIVVDDPFTALQKFAAHHRGTLSLPVLAITGSCGKTTAKDFIAAVLSAKYRVVKTKGNLNNEIGCPLSLLQIDDATEFAIIEMGANHMGEIARLSELARPTESAVTMVAPAHLEGFGSIENVARAKGEIAEGLPPDGRFYVNADDERCVAMGERYPGQKVYFGQSENMTGRNGVILKTCRVDASGEMSLEMDPIGPLRLPLPVAAHATNVMLAVAVGLTHGATEFEAPLREACQNAARFRVHRIGRLEVLDDSYNANPASMAAALEALEARTVPEGGARIAALGEMLELGESAPALHRELGEAAGRRGVGHLFARGPHAHEIIAGARAAGVPHAEAMEDHEAIAQAIHAAAESGGVLLIKGSRGMRMELILGPLRALYDTQSDTATP